MLDVYERRSDVSYLVTDNQQTLRHLNRGIEQIFASALAMLVPDCWRRVETSSSMSRRDVTLRETKDPFIPDVQTIERSLVEQNCRRISFVVEQRSVVTREE